MTEVSIIPVPYVLIFVINWNGWQDTISCLDSIAKINYANMSTLVLDNGSSDESVLILSEWIIGHGGAAIAGNSLDFPGDFLMQASKRGFTFLGVEQNLGFSGGVNLGLKYAIATGADFVWLLNNDALVEPCTLSELVGCAVRDNYDLVGSLVCEDLECAQTEFARGLLPWDFLGIAWNRTRVVAGEMAWQSDWVTFASVLISRKPIEKRLELDNYVLDPSLFMYVEDVDFCFFCKSIGYRIGVSASGRIIHRRSSSSGGVGSSRVFYYITRNRLIVARKWFSKINYSFFVAYYTITRVLLVGRHLLSGRYKNALAVVEALGDGLKNKGGIWRHH